MRRGIVALTAAISVALAGLAAAGEPGGTTGPSTPGVTGTTIRVGGIASPTSVLNVPYVDGFDGAKAYFDRVNARGGVFGKKLELVAQLSDQGAPSGNIRAVRSLVEERNVFAVLPVMTNNFAGAKYLSDRRIPTFGLNVDPGWCGTIADVEAIQTAILEAGRLTDQCPRSSLFGERGSFLCFRCPNPGPSFVALRNHARKAAIFTYSAPSSKLCAEGLEASFARYGIDVVFEDTTLPFGFTDASADAAGVKDHGAQVIATCMDFGGAFRLTRQLHDAGVGDLVVVAPEGYGPATIAKYGRALDGWFFGLGFTPWEGKHLPPGTRAYLAAMKARGRLPTEQSQAGWINAALLVEGIKKAGRSFTRASVVDAINHIDDFTAGGILPGVDWTPVGNGHGVASGPTRAACATYVEAVHGRFVPRYGKPGQPFVCFPYGPLPATLDDPYFRPLQPGETAPTPGTS